MSWLFKNEHEFKNHSNGCCCRLLVTFNWSKINKNWPKINKNSIKLVTIQQNWSKMNPNWPKIYKNERKSVKNQSNWSKFNKNWIKLVKIQQNWSKIGQKSTKFQPNVPIIEDFFELCWLPRKQMDETEQTAEMVASLESWKWTWIISELIEADETSDSG